MTPLASGGPTELPSPGDLTMMSKPGPRKARSVTLRCELLEERDVPCTFSFNPATATLTLTGSAGRDAVVITDNGTNNAGAVTAACNGMTVFTSGPTAGVNQVHSIQVNTLGGKHDSVSYNLTGDMVANNRNLNVTFGQGQGDTFRAELDGSLVNAFLLLQVTGGNGGDRIGANVNGSLNGASFLGLLFKGGAGNDQININATNSVNVGPLAQLTTAVDAGAGNDQVGVAYEGQMQGALFLDAFGGAGKDTVRAALTFDGVSNGLLFGPVSPNTGKAAAQVRGGGGKDRLAFEVDLSGALKPASAAEIDGGAGIDFCHAAGFIAGVFNCERMF
jgi:hypothetical protein